MYSQILAQVDLTLCQDKYSLIGADLIQFMTKYLIAGNTVQKKGDKKK